MKKAFKWAGVVIVIGLVTTLVVQLPKTLTQKPGPTTPVVKSGDQTGPTPTESAPKDLVIGSPQAPITLTEYGDFKCPNCARFHEQAGKDIRKQYIDSGRAKLIFRNLPYIASDSRVAAEGAYCAAEQNLFAAYHDNVFNYIAQIYREQGTRREFDEILTVAKLAELLPNTADKAAFKQCLDGRNHRQLVDQDLKDSEKAKVTGTPTIIIGNQKVIGAQPFATYRILIEAQDD